jgi:acetolactate synthase I/II/III large subunit
VSPPLIITEGEEHDMATITDTTTLTGGEIVGRTLTNYGVEHAAGIPGHGVWSLLDGFLRDGCSIPITQVFHEQSAVHMADGYWRAGGKPMVALTSIGPGAANTLMGLATAFADSTSLLAITGGPATHMRGHGIMQELDRHQANAFPQMVAPAVKRRFEAHTVEELPFILHRAFNAMLTGRPGPVHIEVPMDVQAGAADVSLHDLERRIPQGRIHPDPEAVEAAARVLRDAERPVIVIGGGLITAGASAELRELAEALRAPVVTTWNGKGGFPEDHRLFAGAVGQTGTTVGNGIAAQADVVISVGCRFTDWSASSYRKGVSFSLPPGKLIQIDIDPYEIGKNYPAEVGIVADARPALADLVQAVGRRDEDDAADHLRALDALKAEWAGQISGRTDSDEFPFTSQRPLRDLRRAMERDGIIIAGSGNPQGAVKQSFPVYEPRTHLTAGGYSSMGWAVPAAIGAKLARPDRQVVCLVGDGDFLMSVQELGVVAQHEIPVCFVVANNEGYMSIRGGQRKITDRHVISEFTRKDGSPYGVELAEVARGFGVQSWRVEGPDELESTLRTAIETGGPTLVEVPTARDAAGPWVPGWWDFPVPAYITDGRQTDYWAERAEEQHL